jgi:hypothetical protein
MPVKEIAAKTTAFGLVTLALAASGVFVLYGPHAANDTLNVALGLIMLAFALLTGGVGTVIILGIIAEGRRRQREEALHITARAGPPAPPPAWGMGDIGRPGSGVVGVGEAHRGGGSPRLVSFSISNLDAPVLLGVLLVWTVIAVLLFAPHCGAQTTNC